MTDTATTEESRNARKVREGVVVSNKMEKTAVVAVIERVRHPKYGKFMLELAVQLNRQRVAQSAQMLGPRGRRLLNKLLGIDTVFMTFDAAKRQSYTDRAHAAQGVVEKD